jgi:hypothetical protein
MDAPPGWLGAVAAEASASDPGATERRPCGNHQSLARALVVVFVAAAGAFALALLGSGVARAPGAIALLGTVATFSGALVVVQGLCRTAAAGDSAAVDLRAWETIHGAGRAGDAEGCAKPPRGRGPQEGPAGR